MATIFGLYPGFPEFRNDIAQLIIYRDEFPITIVTVCVELLTFDDFKTFVTHFSHSAASIHVGGQTLANPHVGC